MRQQYFKLIIVALGVLFGFVAQAQILFYNNGTDVFFNTGAVVCINGNTQNNSGTINNNGEFYLNGNITNNAQIQGNGNYYLTGNWVNNQSFLGANSSVYLQGATQTIEGTSSTTFNNLLLSGTDIKYLNINTQVTGVLDLSDRELATESYILSVQNASANAIQRTTGFVSSLTNGFLERFTVDTTAYLFPTGSSSGTLRYRPVAITPQTLLSNTFRVRMVNNDATIDGYNRQQLDTGLCNTEPDFYHLITRTAGTSDATVSIFYDEAVDGYWDAITNWQTSMWYSTGYSILTTATPLNSLTSPVLSDFSNLPYLLAVVPPTINLGQDTSFCSGTFVTLDAGSGFDSYSWSTGDTSQTIDVYTTGTYSVTVSLGTCTASDEIKITEHILNISVGTQDTICQGSSASLFATGGTAFQWSTGDTSANISVTPLATTTYYVTVADSMCSQTDSVIIYVNTLPIADAGSNQIICVSDSATLTATGGDTYLWSTGDTVSTIDVQPLTTTTYIVTVTDVGGCFATDSVTITVINGINISISGDVNICLGENTELTASGASNYLWSTGQVDSSVIVAPVSDSVFTVIGNIGSCYDTLSVTVFVHPLPVVYVSQDTVICSGDTVTITASGGDNYIWSNGVNNASQQVTPNTTTTFYVTVSNAFGCSDTGSATLTVLQTPIADAGGDQTICYGTVVQLSASGGTTYLWEANTSLSDVNISNPMASPMETTTYYVTVSNGNCFDTDSTVITVQPLPQINAGQDTTIYQGEAIQLLATGNVTNFLWSPAAYLSQTDISNPVASPQTTITYTVTGIDVYGCQSSDNITITVTEKPEYELVIYNTFTPNGDGVNDTWYIENIDKYPDNLVQVYNRNGHIVYEKLGYLNEWDGKFYGNDLPAATYYYIINLNDGSELLKGNVTIVR